MHIFLIIFKIIGIIVLILLGMVVTLSLLILFVPVKYSVRADFDNDVRLGIHITWLVRILHCRISYPADELWTVRLFGIPLARSGGTKRKKKRARRKKNYETFESGASKKADTGESRDKSDGTKQPDGGDEKESPKREYGSGKHKRRKPKNKKHNKKENRKRNYLKTFFGIIRDDGNKRIFAFLKDIIIRFLKKVKPKKIRADMVIGLEDPAYTGLLFGGLGILTVFWRGKYNITPDFEKKILKGSVYARGYVRFLDILYILIKIMLNEDIKRVMKKGQVN